MDVPDRISKALLDRLTRIGVEKAQVIVHSARDVVEKKPLRRRRLLIHEKRQALRTRVGEPLVDSEPIAFRFRDLLALVVEKELIIEPLGRPAAERAADFARELDRFD